MIATIIPARGGSKGIPHKNILPFCGKPLIAWSIEQSPFPVYVSTDDLAIYNTAADYGAYPIRRPPELATDTASSESALRHAIDAIGDVDTVIFLQATSPIRTPDDISNALKIFQDGGYDSLFSMCRLDDYCIWEDRNGLASVNFDWKNRVRRQLRKPSYLENGSIFIFKPWVLRETGNRFGGKLGMYEMPFWKSFEIDGPEDVDIVEYYFKRNILGGL
jgi:CMP-N,N'-diacetyllegionaminic acid synthase